MEREMRRVCTLAALVLWLGGCPQEHTETDTSIDSDSDSDSDTDTVTDADSDTDTDTDTSFPLGGPWLLGPGNETGQDEDPAILVGRDGTLHAAWFSNRGGTDGVKEDKEIWVTSSTDGVDWTTPAAATSSPEWAFWPSLAEADDGDLLLAFWRVIPLPVGCTPGVDCTGTDNRIGLVRRTGASWSSVEDVVTGPGDWLPSVVQGPDSVRIYFAAVARAEDGTTDLGQSTSRLFMVESTEEGWSSPTLLGGMNTTDHNSYPSVWLDSAGTTHLTWMRWDGSGSNQPIDVLGEPSTQVWYANSTDGITFTGLEEHGADEALDLWPSLVADRTGSPHLTWLTTGLGDATTVLSEPGGGWEDLIELPEIAGYTGRLAPTPRAGVTWGVYVTGDDPTQRVEHVFIEDPFND